MSEMIIIDSIGALHKILEYDKPKHPLITLIDLSNVKSLKKYTQVKLRLDFYAIALKTGDDCDIKYGRQSYDFSEGSLVFSAPGQTSIVDFDPSAENAKGWMLCFHHDLISGSNLAKQMDHYTYFSYASNEALHLSENEMSTITSIVKNLETEYSMNLDVYSNKLLISNIEVLLIFISQLSKLQMILVLPH